MSSTGLVNSISAQSVMRGREREFLGMEDTQCWIIIVLFIVYLFLFVFFIYFSKRNCSLVDFKRWLSVYMSNSQMSQNPAHQYAKHIYRNHFSIVWIIWHWACLSLKNCFKHITMNFLTKKTDVNHTSLQFTCSPFLIYDAFLKQLFEHGVVRNQLQMN